MGSRTSVSYSSRCASNHSLLLFFASPRRNRRAGGLNDMVLGPGSGSGIVNVPDQTPLCQAGFPNKERHRTHLLSRAHQATG
jgi:hypothetical protein